MKSVIPVVVSDKSAIISDNQEHLTKIHGKLFIHCYVVTIMISRMSKLFIRTEMEDFYWRKMRIEYCSSHYPTTYTTLPRPAQHHHPASATNRSRAHPQAHTRSQREQRRHPTISRRNRCARTVKRPGGRVHLFWLYYKILK